MSLGVPLGVTGRLDDGRPRDVALRTRPSDGTLGLERPTSDTEDESGPSARTSRPEGLTSDVTETRRHVAEGLDRPPPPDMVTETASRPPVPDGRSLASTGRVAEPRLTAPSEETAARRTAEPPVVPGPGRTPVRRPDATQVAGPVPQSVPRRPGRRRPPTGLRGTEGKTVSPAGRPRAVCQGRQTVGQPSRLLGDTLRIETNAAGAEEVAVGGVAVKGFGPFGP